MTSSKPGTTTHSAETPEHRKLVKVTCERCCGTGRYSFNLVHGTRCFKCGGSGFVLADPVKLQRNKKARERAAVKRKEAMEARIAEAARRADEREEKYKHDKRIGPGTRARCERLPAVAHDVYQILFDIDNGKNIHPTVVMRLGD